MAKLRDFLDTWLIAMLSRRLDATEAQHFTKLIAEQRDLIARLKSTDKKRSNLYRKLRSELVRKRKEVKRLSKSHRVMRRLLARRRFRITSLLKHIRLLKSGPMPQNIATWLHPLLDDPPPPAGGLGHVVAHKATSQADYLSNFAWKHWMRLGVLRQYPPRPMKPDTLPQVRLPDSAFPRMCLVTPSFNQAEYLGATMSSVLSQGYPQLEYIVMDGGSTDGSVDIIRAHQEKLAYWQSAPDGGQGAAVDEGFKRSDGEILAWLNSDDLLLPGVLRYVGAYFRGHPEVDVVYGHRLILDSRGWEVGRWVLPRHSGDLLLWADFIPQECCFWRRSAYEKVGGIDRRFRFALDWDLLVRFERAGLKMVRLPYVMGAFRLHEHQKNATLITTAGYQEMAQLRARELQGAFSTEGLARRVTRAQLESLFCLALMRIGIRF